ncbi:short subunit fatty acids transporter [Bradyrhizobium sp. USDA 4486]
MTDTTDKTIFLDETPTKANVLARFSQHMVSFAERWFPDAYVFVLVAVVVIALGTIVHGGSPLAVSRAFGDGFWNLIPFTMQLALAAVAGYVVAMSPPVAALMRRLANVPPPPAAPWSSSAC